MASPPWQCGRRPGTEPPRPRGLSQSPGEARRRWLAPRTEVKRFLKPVRKVTWTTSHISHLRNPDNRRPLKLTTARNQKMVAMLPRSRYLNGTDSLPAHCACSADLRLLVAPAADRARRVLVSKDIRGELGHSWNHRQVARRQTGLCQRPPEGSSQR